MTTTRRPHPYRVGMARPAQRVIEPDAIFYDLRSGPVETIPHDFPYTWTPVNGIGDVGPITQQGVLDDAFNRVVDAIVDTGRETTRGVIDDTKGSLEDRAAQGIQDLIGSGPGQLLLDAVEERAKQGVVDVVKSQAPNLIMMSVAAGAVGGAVSGKLGKVGTMGAIGLALFCAWRLWDAQVPPSDKSVNKRAAKKIAGW